MSRGLAAALAAVLVSGAIAGCVTPPNTWPLVAEQFRATLAYHQQLVAQEQATSPTANALPCSSASPVPTSRKAA